MIEALGITLLITIGLAVWARWLGRLDGVPRFVRYLVWLCVFAWAGGAVGSLWGPVNAFGAVSGPGVDPSQKARILAESISEAMNLFAFSVGTLLLGGMVMLGLTWKYRWSAKPPEIPKNPPYR